MLAKSKRLSLRSDTASGKENECAKIFFALKMGSHKSDLQGSCAKPIDCHFFNQLYQTIPIQI